MAVKTHSSSAGSGMTTGNLPECSRHDHPIQRKARRMHEALKAIYEAGRMSDQSRAKYCADIAKAALDEVES